MLVQLVTIGRDAEFKSANGKPFLSLSAAYDVGYGANKMVGNAIRDKKLIRPNNCSNCGIECIPDGHHNDYAYPLSVTWLCRQCHNDWHKTNTPLNGDIDK